MGWKGGQNLILEFLFLHPSITYPFSLFFSKCLFIKSVYFCKCLSIQCIFLNVFLFNLFLLNIYPICLCTCLSIQDSCFSKCLSIQSANIYQSMWFYKCLSIHLPLYLSVCLNILSLWASVLLYAIKKILKRELTVLYFPWISAKVIGL